MSDGGAGFFVRYQTATEATYRLLRAPSVAGPWSAVVTNTAPASGYVEFDETNPPAGQAFYRVVLP